MAGKVAEGCSDCGQLRTRVKVNPKGPASGTSKYIKGGSWMDGIKLFDSLRCSHTTFPKPHVKAENFGFRGVIPASVK